MFETDTEFNLLEYLTIIQKRFLLILLSVLVGMTAISLYVYIQPLFYKSSETVLFEYDTPSAGILTQSYVYSQKIIPQIEKELILNSKILGRVYKRIHPNSNLKEGTPIWYAKVNSLKNYVKITFQDTQNINVIYATKMLADISATTPTPKLAKKLLKYLVEEYQFDQSEYKLQQDLSTKNWLDTQLKESKARIEAAEKKFQKFKQDKGILSLKELQEAQVDNYSLLEKDYNEAVRERKKLEMQLDNLQNAIKMDESISNLIFSNEKYLLITKYVSELNIFKIELNNLLKTFKEKHPKILELKEKMKITRQKIEQAKLDAVRKLKIQLETAISIEQRKYADMMSYKGKALEISNDALQYTLLKREVTTSRQLYDLLAKQLKENTVRNSASSVNLRVVEPPIMPLAPISKKYPLKIVIGIFIGLVFGISLAFILEYTDISIKTPDDVKFYFDLPVAGMIPLMELEFDESKLEDLTNRMVLNYEEQGKN